MNNYVLEVLEDKSIESNLEKIFALSKIEEKAPEKLTNDIIISFISRKFKPRFKDYDFYLESGLKVSGAYVRNLEKGKKA